MSDRHFPTRELPPGLQPLAGTIIDLATDLRWTWSHAGDAVWEEIDPETWEQTENPYVLLQNLTRERLATLDKSESFKKSLEKMATMQQDYCTQAGWYGTTYTDAQLKGIAYFSLEFGLGQALPLYAGGLGVLAGDHLKAASDLGVPLTGIGLLYQEGYFRQVLDNSGWQQEVYPYNDSTGLPISPTSAPDGSWLHVELNLPGRKLRLRVWEARVGRVTLYLLDSNDPINTPGDRGVTSKLYGGSHELRLMQEFVLGICGWRLIEALQLEIDVCHINEGHAAFVTLERARSFMKKNGTTFEEALWATRAGNIFTTHTPVAAGFDTYDPALLIKYGKVYTDSLGVTPEFMLGLGRKNNGDTNEPFNMAYLAMRTCCFANGVSKLHGEVSRGLFKKLYPQWPVREIPVTHITNGIHVPSWDSPWADGLWTRACGKGRWLGSPEELAAAINGLSDEQLWTFRGQERADLVAQARKRLARLVAQRGDDPADITLANNILDPNTLTLGFARRFTEYKRPNLLLHDIERLSRILCNAEKPVQIIIAGKAHPLDEEGKRLVQAWAQFVNRADIRAHAVFLEDYDIALAQEMVQGVDVWINTPRRPWEASGTSGMKVLVNGGLNVSELDGWWAEAYTPEVGWAIGDGQEHSDPNWDDVEAEQLYQLLEQEIVPLFYDRDASGIPRNWVARIRKSMSELAPQFSTNRMVCEYVENLYLVASNAYHQRAGIQGSPACQLAAWEKSLHEHWHGIHFGNVDIQEQDNGIAYQVHIYFGDISATDVKVELYAERCGDKEAVTIAMQNSAEIPGAVNGFIFFALLDENCDINNFTVRVLPFHPLAHVPTEVQLIAWQH